MSLFVSMQTEINDINVLNRTLDELNYKPEYQSVPGDYPDNIVIKSKINGNRIFFMYNRKVNAYHISSDDDIMISLQNEVNSIIQNYSLKKIQEEARRRNWRLNVSHQENGNIKVTLEK